MEHYDIEEIKSNVEGMSLREKIEYLRDVQEELIYEIDELETVEGEVKELLNDAEDQVGEKYDSEIGAALKEVLSAHPDKDCSLYANTLDFEGMLFCFIYLSEEGVNQLSIRISGLRPITRVVDFNAEFGDIVKQLFPEAKYRNMLFDFNLATEADLIPLVKEIAEKLLSINQKIEHLASKYGVWG